MTEPGRALDQPVPWLPEPKGDGTLGTMEKASRLEASLERFAQCVAERLGSLLGATFLAEMEATEAVGTFALFAEHEGRTAAVLRSEAYDTRLALVLEPEATDVVVGAIFGVDQAHDNEMAPGETQRRPRTEIETRILDRVCQSIAEALNDAFQPEVDLGAAHETLRTLIDVNLLGPRDMAAIAVQFQLKCAAGGFGFCLALPQSLTAELSDMLSRRPEQATVKLDPHWAKRMEDRVSEARLTLTAILDELESTLGEVSGLKLGQVIPLSDDGQGHVRIECVERGIFVCKLGERHQRYALEVEDIIAAPAQGAYPPSTV